MERKKVGCIALEPNGFDDKEQRKRIVYRFLSLVVFFLPSSLSSKCVP